MLVNVSTTLRLTGSTWLRLSNFWESRRHSRLKKVKVRALDSKAASVKENVHEIEKRKVTLTFRESCN